MYLKLFMIENCQSDNFFVLSDSLNYSIVNINVNLIAWFRKCIDDIVNLYTILLCGFELMSLM